MSSEDAKPAGFTVAYTWQAGSMPPPYHYEYSIHIGPESQGEIVFYPDYPSDGTPRWTETFSIADQRLDELHALIIENDLQHRDWPEERDEPIGGRQEWLEIMDGDETVALPGRASRDQGAAEVYAFIRSLVPEILWAELMSRREEYERRYEDRAG